MADLYPDDLPADDGPDDAYCPGDPTLDDVDPVQLSELFGRMEAVNAIVDDSERLVAAQYLVEELNG